MFATATVYKLPFMGAFQGLRTFRPAVAVGQRQARSDYRQEADLDCLPQHTLDNLDVLSGDGCVSEWGLVECAGRLRSGWS